LHSCPFGGSRMAPIMISYTDGERRGVEYSPLPTTERQSANRVDIREPEFVNSTLVHRWKSGECTIVPEGNALIDVWDVIMISALLATAVLLPFEVGLMPDPSSLLRSTLGAIDIVFLIDIFLAFFIAYGKVSITNRDMYEVHPLKIARHYMAFPFAENCTAGWFWADVVTVIPWDKIRQARGGASLRLIRILRLIRMFRLVRVIKLLRKWQTHFGHPVALLNISTCLGWTVLTCHWLACVWGHFAVNPEFQEENWFVSYLRQYGEQMKTEDFSPIEIYSMALYWSLSTLTSVGYGDVLPQNQHEMVMTSVSMFMLGIMWAWVLANVVNIITNMDAFANESNQLMDDLNLLMEHRGLEHNLRQRLRKHLSESFHVYRQRHQQRTIKWLSAGLQGEIAVESGVDKVCECIWYLKGMPDTVLIAIAQRFVADMFSPCEYLQDRYSLFVIRKGTCVLRRKLLTRDDVVGEDMILASDRLKDSVCPKSLTFVEVMTLSRNDLLSVCERNPDFDRRVRKAQIKLALWRSFVRSAEMKKSGETMKYFDLPRAEESIKHRPGFSQSIQTVRGFKGLSVQDSLGEIMEELQALRRRVDDNHMVNLRHFEIITSRLDKLDERAEGTSKRGCAKLPFCGRPLK